MLKRLVPHSGLALAAGCFTAAMASPPGSAPTDTPLAPQRDAGLADAHPRRRQPSELPGHLRGQRGRRGVELADCALLRRRQPVRAHRIPRRADAHASSATTTWCTRCGRRAGSRWSSSGTCWRRFRRCCRRATTASSPSTTCSAQGTRTHGRAGCRCAAAAAEGRPALRLSAVGRPGDRPAAARRGAGRARRGARVVGLLRPDHRRQGAARQRACCR